MTDTLIARLRGQAYTHSRPDQLNAEAADRIEALQAEVEAVKATNASQIKTIERYWGEVDTLQSRITALEGQEPVAYEFRMRADWVADWGLWSPCSKEHHEMYIRTPKLHDWVYETRASFLAAGAAPKEQT